jgi:hypothetical protein
MHLAHVPKLTPQATGQSWADIGPVLPLPAPIMLEEIKQVIGYPYWPNNGPILASNVFGNIRPILGQYCANTVPILAQYWADAWNDQSSTMSTIKQSHSFSIAEWH